MTPRPDFWGLPDREEGTDGGHAAALGVEAGGGEDVLAGGEPGRSVGGPEAGGVLDQRGPLHRPREHRGSGVDPHHERLAVGGRDHGQVGIGGQDRDLVTLLGSRDDGLDRAPAVRTRGRAGCRPW